MIPGASKYITYTERVKQKIAEAKNYPLVDLEINVDGTACLLIKYFNGRYFEKKLTHAEMQKSVVELSTFIIRSVESYFNGWAAKKYYTDGKR